MVPDSDLELGQIRLLEVDNPIKLPEDTHVRFIVTSTDVLHDFAIPAAGVKMDATPGRLNHTGIKPMGTGEFFGQCSELCGAYHGFMPIQLEVSTVENYLSWISSLGLFLFLSRIPLLNSISTKVNKIILTPLKKLSPVNIFNLLKADDELNKGKTLKYLDIILFTVVFFFVLYDLSHLLFIVFDKMTELLFYNGTISQNEFLCAINGSTSESASVNAAAITNAAATSSTHTTIIHNDGSWSNGVRQIFVYGTGVWRLTLLRGGGSPLAKGFIIGSTIAADFTTKVLNNTINDPYYVKNQ